MELPDILAPERVKARLKAANKKHLLEALAGWAAQVTGCDRQVILDTLNERERLGSTGIGQGIAIPHGRIEGLDGFYGFFARLEPPIAFEAIDDQPVDLVFLLLTPEGSGVEHLKALACVSRLLRNRGTCDRLRRAENPDVLYLLLTQPAASHAA